MRPVDPPPRGFVIGDGQPDHRDQRGDLFIGRERRQHVILFAATLAAAFPGEAHRLDRAKPEAVADRAGLDQPGLDPAAGQRNVGAGEEAAAAAQPGTGLVQPEAPFAKEGANEAGRDPGHDQHRQPALGQAVLIGNVIAQGPHPQNPVLVAYGAEGPAWPASGLYMAHNTLVNDRLGGAWFLRVWRDKLPASTPVHLVNNLSVGLGVFSWGLAGGATALAGNVATVINPLIGTADLPYRLPSGGALRGKGVRPGVPDGIDLRPTAEFSWPIGSRPLAEPATWSPGAFQN